MKPDAAHRALVLAAGVAAAGAEQARAIGIEVAPAARVGEDPVVE